MWFLSLDLCVYRSILYCPVASVLALEISTMKDKGGMPTKPLEILAQ